MKFKKGDEVEIINNQSGSFNKIGDIGVVTEICTTPIMQYRVNVEGREEIGNWHHTNDLKSIEKALK